MHGTAKISQSGQVTEDKLSLPVQQQQQMI